MSYKKEEVEEKEDILKELKNQMSEEARNRKNILKEVNKNIDGYSDQLIDYENKISAYEIKEIEFKNQERELEDYIEMYKEKSKENEEMEKKFQKELIKLRKQILNDEMMLSTFKSIVSVFVNDMGIDKVSEITGIEQDNIEKYLQD